MSDTPRTDAEELRDQSPPQYVLADFARELERELNRLRRVLEYVRDSSDGAENAFQYISQTVNDET